METLKANTIRRVMRGIVIWKLNRLGNTRCKYSLEKRYLVKEKKFGMVIEDLKKRIIAVNLSR